MKKTAFIYIIIAGILWGTSGIFSSVLSPYGFTPFHLTAIRGTVSLVGIFIYILIKDRKLFKAKPTELLLYLGSGISLFITASSYYSCMRATSISTAVVLMYMAPVIVMVISVIFLDESFNKFKLISVFLMLIGCALVSGIIGGLKFNVTGILLGVLSAVAYSAYNILAKIEMQKNASPISATFYCFLVITVISMAVSKPLDIVYITAEKPLVILPLLIGLGVCTFIIPYILYTIALKYLPAGTASALSIVEPMAATVFSVVIFREQLSVPSAIGIIMIILAVFLLSRTEKESKKIRR